MDPDDANVSAILACLLNSSPNLQELVIKILGSWKRIWNEEETPLLCIFNHLTTARIYTKEAGLNQLIPFARFLLKNALALKKLLIYSQEGPLQTGRFQKGVASTAKGFSVNLMLVPCSFQESP